MTGDGEPSSNLFSVSRHSVFCLLPLSSVFSCLLPPASCLLSPAFCLLPSDSYLFVLGRLFLVVDAFAGLISRSFTTSLTPSTARTFWVTRSLTPCDGAFPV